MYTLFMLQNVLGFGNATNWTLSFNKKVSVLCMLRGREELRERERDWGGGGGGGELEARKKEIGRPEIKATIARVDEGRERW